MTEGIPYALYRLKSYLSLQGRYYDTIKGMPAYQLHKNLSSNFSEYKSESIKLLEELKDSLFTRENLLLHITGDDNIAEEVKKHLGILTGSLKKASGSKLKPVFPKHTENQAILTPAEIVFVIEGAALYDLGLEYHGSFEVLQKYLSRVYLFNEIRTKGGAYGANVIFNDIEGDFYLMSYRDPHLKNTYEAYRKIPENLNKLSLNKKEMEKLIIGAYSDFDPLLNASDRGVYERDNYLSGITKKDIELAVKQILATDTEQIRSYSSLFEKFSENSFKTIIGNRDKIQQNKSMFTELLEV